MRRGGREKIVQGDRREGRTAEEMAMRRAMTGWMRGAVAGMVAAAIAAAMAWADVRGAEGPATRPAAGAATQPAGISGVDLARYDRGTLETMAGQWYRAAAALEQDNRRLRGQIAELQRQVEELRRRINSVRVDVKGASQREQKPAGTLPSGNAKGSKTIDTKGMEGTFRLSVGMTVDEVAEMFGEKGRLMGQAAHGNQEYQWHSWRLVPGPAGSGPAWVPKPSHIYFVTVRDGKVVSWSRLRD